MVAQRRFGLTGETLARTLEVLLDRTREIYMSIRTEVEDRHAELVRLCQTHHVRRLELFGSATGPEFDPRASDLDFLVDFEEIPPREHARAYFGLLEGLEALFQRPVDLVERRAIRNPYFLEAIADTRELLHEST